MKNTEKKNVNTIPVHREPLTSDLVFKAVFGSDTPESKNALIELLNLILKRADDPIVDLVYKNPFSYAEAAKEKVIVMDIKVETSKGELIDIEMQVGELDVFVNRSIYYGCRQLTKGISSGDNYGEMKPSIVIGFVKGKLFPCRDSVHSIFTLRENTDSMQLSDILELHYIELGKIDWADKSTKDLDPIEQIGAYMRCSGDTDELEFIEELVDKGERVISMADKILRKVSEEERLQNLRESREMALMQISWEKKKAHREGHAEGIAEGLIEGERSKSFQIAAQMKADGIDIEQISKYTLLTRVEIEKI